MQDLSTRIHDQVQRFVSWRASLHAADPRLSVAREWSSIRNQMAKRNEFDGYCSVCGEAVRADDGFVTPDPDARRGYLILCVQHAPGGQHGAAFAA